MGFFVQFVIGLRSFKNVNIISLQLPVVAREGFQLLMNFITPKKVLL
jgi:hypothetical protein